MNNTLPAQLQDFTLYGSGSSTGDTALTLTTFTDPLGVPLTMASFGSIGYGTIEPNNGSNEDSIVFTGITQNANGTATLTGVHSVGFTYPYTASSGLRIPHAGGVTFIISNTSYFYYSAFSLTGNTTVITGPYVFTNAVTASGFIATTNGITASGTSTFLGPVNVGTPVLYTQAANQGYVTQQIANEDALVVHIAGTETVTGHKTFNILPSSGATPTNTSDLTTKTYVDNVALSGGPNASTSTKGIVQIATAVQASSGTATGSTGALLVPPNSLYSSISTGSTTVVVTLGSGKIDSSYLSSGSAPIGGDGSDGNLTISSGTTTLTRDMYYQNLTVNGTGTLKTASYRVYVSGILTVDTSGGGGGVNNAGSNGGGAVAAAGGVLGSVISAGTLPAPGLSTAGGNGLTNATGASGGISASAAGASLLLSLGVSGATGGTAGNGGGAGLGGTAGAASSTSVVIQPRSYTWANNLFQLSTATTTVIQRFLASGGSGGGGGGGTGSFGGSQTGYTGAGGAAGGAGGFVWIEATTVSLTGSSAINANGGNGGNASTSTGTNVSGGGGGGAAGSGGIIILIYQNISGAGTLTVAAGSAGSGSAGTNGGGSGANGGSGTNGVIIEIVM